jgi:uridine kinase
VSAGLRDRVMVIGIAGGSGAGKTLLARLIRERYADVQLSVLDEDSYYMDRGDVSESQRGALNYDEPAGIDHETLVAHLELLRSRRPTLKPRYCFVTHRRLAEADAVSPSDIVIVEGLFALWHPRVRALLDLKVFIDVNADLRFIRRLRRDITERGRSVDSVIDQYLATVRPMYQLHVAPTRQYADLVISGDHFDGGVSAAIAAIDSRLRPSLASGGQMETQRV